jgi:3-methyl-2-oxobutanoate hydroxymethyltransferase
MIGMSFGRLPRFVRQYANIREVMTEAVTNWMEDVKNGNYPSDKESYGLPAEAKAELNRKS